jgi:monofunctional biosynthetic peptidoglycan transglycosylase
VAQKDSQDGTESDTEGRAADHPRTEGRAAGGGSLRGDGTGETARDAPVDLAPAVASGDDAPTVDEPVDAAADASTEMAGEEAPLSEIIESGEPGLPEQAGAVALSVEQLTVEPHEAGPAPQESAEALANVEPQVSQASVEADAPPIAVSDFERRKGEALRLLKKGARYVAYGIAGYLALVVFLIFAYRLIDPPGSTLMLIRLLGGTAIERTWVPLERISPNLVRAVIVAEDGRFCEHWGIDFEAIQEAIRRSGDGTPRGASTISMQVTKNLFLWPSKSYVRKVIELPLTLLIELVWPKRRILEIYLNVAEWGPGVFGAEAAARYHFRRPASRLGEREAALLAAALPNPVRRDAGDPGPRTSSKARVIQARMHVSGPVAACVLGGR